MGCYCIDLPFSDKVHCCVSQSVRRKDYSLLQTAIEEFYHIHKIIYFHMRVLHSGAHGGHGFMYVQKAQSQM